MPTELEEHRGVQLMILTYAWNSPSVLLHLPLDQSPPLLFDIFSIDDLPA